MSTVLDLTCGTGSQVFWLEKAGFKVVGSDISSAMIKIAQEKARMRHLELKFVEGDCRTIQIGKFDSVITIFNSVGHLSRDDFGIAIQNIRRNLNPGGLYIFDIFNLDYLKHDKNIAKLTIDSIIDDGTREIQFSTISNDGILASYTTYVSKDNVVSTGYSNTLQIYNITQLEDILKKHGFTILDKMDVNSESFSEKTTERILVVAES